MPAAAEWGNHATSGGVTSDDSGLTPPQEMRVIQKALRWPITDEIRRSIIGTLLRIVADQDNPRYRLKAIHLLVMAEAQNQRDQHLTAIGTLPVAQQVESREHVDMIKDLLNQDDYLDYLREKARSENSDARSLGGPHQPGEVAAGRAPSDNGSGAGKGSQG